MSASQQPFHNRSLHDTLAKTGCLGAIIARANSQQIVLAAALQFLAAAMKSSVASLQIV